MAKEAPPGVNVGSVVDGFEIMEVIGRGAFSHVHIAKHTATGNYCAAKVIELGTMRPEEFAGMVREVSVFMQVDHPNICNLYRMSIVEDNLIFFIEFAPKGTLLDYVNGKGGLKEVEAQKFFIQCFAALRHLHLYHFLVHRDLKLENLLLDAKGNVKVTDFGLAGTYYNTQMRTFVGTAGYQPPEIISGSDYDEKCDVWSLGVCLYAMVTGKLPFTSQNHDVSKLVAEASRFAYPKTFSPPLVDLLKKMFAVRAADRPSLMQLQNHPWCRGLQQIGSNVAPQPILFYKVTKASGISRFKRRTYKAEPKVLEQCEGVDAEQLTQDLKNGVTNETTTTYFFMMRPLKTKPEIKPPEVAKVDVPGARKTGTSEVKEAPSPGLKPVAARNGSVPVLAKTQKVAFNSPMAKEPRVAKPSGTRGSVQPVPRRPTLPVKRRP